MNSRTKNMYIPLSSESRQELYLLNINQNKKMKFLKLNRLSEYTQSLKKCASAWKGQSFFDNRKKEELFL